MKINFVFLFFLVLVGGCKFPLDRVSEIDLDLDGKMVNNLVKVTISLEDGLPSNKVNVFLSGTDSKYFFDIEGKRNFNAEGGEFEIVLSPNANPSVDKPLALTLNIDKLGYLPVVKTFFIFNVSEKQQVFITLRKENNLLSGETYSRQNAQLSTLSISDTFSFSSKLSSGEMGIIKFPINGLKFLKKSSFTYLQADLSSGFSEIISDTQKYGTELLNWPTLINRVYYQSERQSDIGYHSIEFTGKKINVLGYKGKSKVSSTAEFGYGFLCDTVGITNVTVVAYTTNNHFDLNFTDEGGNQSVDSRFFSDVIEIPRLYFYDSRTGTPLIPIYTNEVEGPSYEFPFSDNTHKFLVEGFFPSWRRGEIAWFKKVSKVSPEWFEVDGGGKYILRFKNNLLLSRLFLFKNQTNSCQFSKIAVELPNLKLNQGFFGRIEISNNSFLQTFPFLGDNGRIECLVPAGLEPVKIKVFINHHENSCSSGNSLFEREFGPFDLCDKANKEIKLQVNYSGIEYLSTLPKLVPIHLKAVINCPQGNTVIPPTVYLKFWKINCPNSIMNLKIENGEFSSNGLVVDGETYVVRYDKISSSGSPIRVIDTITFDSKQPDIGIVDEKYGFWNGNLAYSEFSGFRAELYFDNRKMKVIIPGCR